MFIISQASIYDGSSGGNAPVAVQLTNPTAATPFPAYLTDFTGLSSTAALVVGLPGTRRLEGVPFRVVASGFVTTGVLSTFTPALYWANVTDFKAPNSSVNAKTIANDLVAASVVSAAISGTFPWLLEAMLIGDSKSQTINGSVKFQIGGTFTASAAITNALTSASTPAFPAGGLAGLGSFALGKGAGDIGGLSVEQGVYFLVAASFGTGNAGNIAQLDSFYVEAGR